jgi:hypothetical protein
MTPERDEITNLHFREYYDAILPHVKLFEERHAWPYLQRSFGILSSWLENHNFTEKTDEELGIEILSMNTDLEAQAQRFCRGNCGENCYHFAGLLIEKSMQFLPRIRRLGSLDGGLEYAFNLLLFLGRQSYIETGSVQSWQVNVDGRIDFEYFRDSSMLNHFAIRFKETYPNFEFDLALETLQTETEYLATIGSKNYLPHTFKLLASLAPYCAQKWAEGLRDEVKAKIVKRHTGIVKRYSIYLDDEKRPKGDWLGVAMETFLPETKSLAQLRVPEGRLLAIDLIIFLGEHSYTDTFMDYTSGGEGVPARPTDVNADNLLLEVINDDSEQGINPHADDILVNIMKSRGVGSSITPRTSSPNR